MAIDYNQRYPSQVDTDPAYPQGKARNKTTPASTDGTPFEKDYINDQWGFLQALLKEANVTPSGIADTADNSQYLTAMKSVVGDSKVITNSDGSSAQDTHEATKAILKSQGLSGDYGFFAKGFNYVNVGDVGITSEAKIYTYVGSGAPVKIVVAGTNPTGNEDYELVELDDFSHMKNRTTSNLLTSSGRTQEDKNYENLTIADFGEVGGTNASPAINAMLQEVGYFTLPAGKFLVQDQLIIPATAYDRIYSGKGMGYSKLEAVGMDGASLIINERPDTYIKTCMRDFSIGGELDSCINLTVSGGYQLYNSEFRNMVLTSKGDAAFKANQHFSTSWNNIHFSSEEGNSMEIQGGNSTVLINCYAHLVGEGKAGYRIKGSATMIGCNGIDEQVKNTWWGHFGSLSENRAYRIHIIGGNAEDWNLGVAKLENFGTLKIETQTHLSRSSGTWDSLITATNGSNHYVDIDEVAGVISKGSTMNPSTLSPIRSSGGMRLRHKSSTLNSIYSEIERTDTGLVVAGVEETVQDDGYLEQSLFFNKINTKKSAGFSLSAPKTLVANTAIVDVTEANVVKTANTSSTNLTNMTGVQDGVELALLIKDDNTTVKHNVGGAGGMVLSGGSDISTSAGDVIKFVGNSGKWVQV